MYTIRIGNLEVALYDLVMKKKIYIYYFNFKLFGCREHIFADREHYSLWRMYFLDCIGCQSLILLSPFFPILFCVPFCTESA